MTRYRLRLTALIATAALAGCGTSPTANFYTLDAGVVPAHTEVQPSYSVAIGVVTVPPMLERPQLVVRAGTNQVAINDFERWAGPLKGEIAQAIADDLTQMLDGAIVYAYPQGVNVIPSYKVHVDVQRFDSAVGDAATVEVLWRVSPAEGEPKDGRTSVREATEGPSYGALVAAHSRALAAVSRDIANAIRATGPAAK